MQALNLSERKQETRRTTSVRVFAPASGNLSLNGSIIKKHTVVSKSITSIEESKKGYTGDALALRGDERRDKLR